MRRLVALSLTALLLTSAQGFVVPWNEEARFQKLLRARDFDAIEARLTALDRDVTDPLMRDCLYNAFEGLVRDTDDATRAIDQWCQQRPSSHIAFTAKGYLYTDIAWKHRGCDFASQVPAENMRRFHEALLTAEAALTKAYALNPSFPFSSTEMITVSMGLCRPRPEMESWFQRATCAKTLDPRAYACKELYLQPKWLGSIEELLDYCREVDRPDVPVLIVATTYGNTWLDLTSRRAQLLNETEFLSRAAQAYDRSTRRYFWRHNQHLYCAFLACRAHNYPLAVKHFNWVEWRDGDEKIGLWKMDSGFRVDRATAFREAPGAIDFRIVFRSVLGLTAALFYIPVIFLAHRERRTWRDTLFLGASLAALACFADSWQPGIGTITFVGVHVATACRILRERRARAAARW